MVRVPATNNAAEHALRHAVMWRKTSHGTRADHGNRLVKRLLSVHRNLPPPCQRMHDYLTAAITADLHNGRTADPHPDPDPRVGAWTP